MSGEKRFSITDQRVEEYLNKVLKPYDGVASEIGLGKSRRELPTAEIITLRLLEIMVYSMKAEHVLEIGTAEGRSAIILAQAIGPGGKIDTIEIDFASARKAKENFKKAGVADRINSIAGDAEDVLKNLNKDYDVIFIDAAKGQYVKYYELCADMVRPGGIIFADNVLYRGMTAGGANINRRQQLLVTRLRQYIDNAVKDDRFITDVLPIGDGVCISYRKGNNKNEKS
jgi:predicted O-methyltransferase YrrM